MRLNQFIFFVLLPLFCAAVAVPEHMDLAVELIRRNPSPSGVKSAKVTAAAVTTASPKSKKKKIKTRKIKTKTKTTTVNGTNVTETVLSSGLSMMESKPSDYKLVMLFVATVAFLTML